MVVCIVLSVDDVLRRSLPALICPGDRVTWKVLAEYIWSPTTTQSGSFLCTTASSMPIQVVTKEVRYIHELSLTLEHFMSISSPAVLGLTLGDRVTWKVLVQYSQSPTTTRSGSLGAP